MRSAFAIAVSLALLAAACGERSDLRDTQFRLEIEGADPDPEREGGLLLDFGEVYLEREARRAIVLRNRSDRSVEIRPIALEAPFGTSHPLGGSVPPHGTLTIDVTFAPGTKGPAGADTAVISRERTFPLRVAGSGRKARVQCTPGVLDYRSVAIGAAKTLAVTCTNDTDRDLAVTASAVEGDAGFTFEGGTTLHMPAGESADLRVAFAPQESALYLANFAITSEPVVKLPRVQLRGVGQRTGLLGPGWCLFRTPTAMGQSDVDWIPLGNFDATGHLVERIEAPTAYEITGQVPFFMPADDLDRAGMPLVSVPVRFTPQHLGPHDGTVKIHTSDPQNPVIDVCVTGFGGGPNFTCLVDELDFGDVAVGVPVRRTIICENRGAGPPDDPKTHLEIYTLGVSAPGFRAELADPLRRSIPPGERFAIDITAKPDAEGGVATVALFLTSDSAAQDERLRIRANGVSLPPCAYTLEPEALDFTAVGDVRTLQLHNVGTHACLVHHVAALGESYALETEVPPGTYVEPGETLAIDVHAIAAPAAGTLELQISDRMQPLVQLPLDAAP